VNTTVFITRSLKNAASSSLGGISSISRCLDRFLVGLCLCMSPFLAQGESAAPATEITQLRVERADDGIQLSALVRFDLAPVVQEALLKGIPLFFVVEADIYRERWYWTDPRVASAARTLRLAYQPLTGRWRVNIASGLITSSAGLRAALNQNYDTLDEALSTIQRVARWKIADTADLDPGAAHTLDFSFRLDLSQLPRPFQIGMAGQREWSISAQFKDRLRLELPAAPAAAVREVAK
jgi:hypothetical protein